jgi:hypothetical protein
VASRGLPGRAAIGLVAFGLVAVIGVALAGRAADGSPVPGAERPGWTTAPTRGPAAAPPPPAVEPAPAPLTPWFEYLAPGETPALATGVIVPRDAVAGSPAGRSRPTGGSPLPDFAGALVGDDGAGPLPLGTIDDVPDDDRLDFLFEPCRPGCFRDAHWMDPVNPRLGSGVWTAGRPFHVREGFINDGSESLGAGFDVALYVTRLADPEEPTYRFTSDYVLRGTTTDCGPTYETQAGPATCEWFVHDFPRGLPEGRFAIWAVWEAPCRAWIDLGLTTACDDPDEVVSFFSSGFDAPYDRLAGPSFDEVRVSWPPATPRPRERW